MGRGTLARAVGVHEHPAMRWRRWRCEDGAVTGVELTGAATAMAVLATTAIVAASGLAADVVSPVRAAICQTAGWSCPAGTAPAPAVVPVAAAVVTDAPVVDAAASLLGDAGVPPLFVAPEAAGQDATGLAALPVTVPLDVMDGLLGQGFDTEELVFASAGDLTEVVAPVTQAPVDDGSGSTLGADGGVLIASAGVGVSDVGGGLILSGAQDELARIPLRLPPIRLPPIFRPRTPEPAPVRAPNVEPYSISDPDDPDPDCAGPSSANPGVDFARIFGQSESISRYSSITASVGDCVGFSGNFIGASAADIVTSDLDSRGDADRRAGVDVQDMTVEVEVFAVGVGVEGWEARPGTPAAQTRWTVTAYPWGTMAKASFPAGTQVTVNGEPGIALGSNAAEGLKVEGGLISGITHKAFSTLRTSDGKTLRNELAAGTIPGLQLGEIGDGYEIGLQPSDVLTDLDPIAGLPSASQPLGSEVVFGSDAWALPTAPATGAQVVAGPPVVPAPDVQYTISDLPIAPPEAGEVIGVLEPEALPSPPTFPTLDLSDVDFDILPGSDVVLPTLTATDFGGLDLDGPLEFGFADGFDLGL